MSSPQLPAGTTMASILVVEDDPKQLRIYGRALLGYRLICVSSGTAALQVLEESLPDLVILDHVLEGSERGLDFLPLLKQKAPQIPVIVISGSLNVKQQMASLSGPRSAHYALEKPVDLDELDRVVEIALTECGMAEMVHWLKSLEQLDKIDGDEPDRRFTERLARQHEILKILRGADMKPNISQLGRDYCVSRKTIIRDLRELIHRGQIDAAVYPDAPAED